MTTTEQALNTAKQLTAPLLHAFLSTPPRSFREYAEEMHRYFTAIYLASSAASYRSIVEDIKKRTKSGEHDEFILEAIEQCCIDCAKLELEAYNMLKIHSCPIE